MIPYAILDLGRNKANIKNVPFSDNPAKMLEAMQNLNGHAVIRVLENDNFLFICLTRKGLSGDVINCLYNKRTKDLKLLKDEGLLNDVDGGIPFFPRKHIKENELIAWKNADEFKEEILSLDYDTQKAKYGERFEKVYQLAKSLKEDDNPVLIIAK